jgi:hypothetical protein
MPMARLAEYMAELARVLGEPSAVHFERLDTGSTILVHKVEREAVPKVTARVVAIRRGDAPSDAERAAKALNRLLRDDDAVGVLQEKTDGAVIIRFPGREIQEERFPSVKEVGTIDGVLTRLEGSDQTIHIGLEVAGRQVSGCYTDRETAKRLARHFFEPIRLFGRGSWSRDGDGVWTLRSFRIENFEPLSNSPLSEAIADLRGGASDWGRDAYAELDLIRHGPSERKNGGH